MSGSVGISLPGILAGILTVTGASAGSKSTVDFARDVRPILSGHCFKCHGPDEAKRKGNLRLDQPDAALHPARSGRPAIVPGDISSSELVLRIRSLDPDEVMPPPSTKHPLTTEQKTVLSRWIEAGAVYQPHWAFVAPRTPPVPDHRQTTWPRNPIDHFVLARLEAEGHSPSPPADRSALVRRVYLDLIGLPPTPAQADAFLRDPTPEAYDRLVDRLLSSSRYGERWARRWLDLARYADTNGYEKDRPRSIWPYRDWVIRALNEGKPFDRFTEEQLAGDILAQSLPEDDPRRLDLRVATGFHRNTMLNEEGGNDPQEYRFHATVDRVHVTATTWLGLTMACAQCHTHKYDPIQQREYYRFMAFLNNADEPWIEVPKPDIAETRERLLREIDDLERALVSQFSERENLDQRLADWITSESARVSTWRPLTPIAMSANIPTLTVEPSNTIFVSGDFSKRDVYDIDLRGDWAGARAIRLEVLPDDRLPGRGPGRVQYEGPIGDFFLSDLALYDGEIRLPILRAEDSFHQGDNDAAKAVDGDLQSGWSIKGGQGRSHNAVFVLEDPIASDGPLRLRLVFEKYYAAGLGKFRLWASGAPDAHADPHPNDIRALLLAYGTAEATSAPKPPEANRLRTYFVRRAPALAAEQAHIEERRAKLPTFPTTLVMNERPAGHERTTHIHHRGEYLQPTEAVAPGLPAFLPGLPPGQPTNRLGLARWLVSPENPLTARVVMNRHWQAFFGQGLVTTMEDFGLQGALPTHPRLLDWLATEFVRLDWSMKEMHRLMVTSAAYRQTSRVTPAQLAWDPRNTYVGRGPRFRMDAEQVRDAFLVASGLLSDAMGGPSVFPPQLPGITTEGAYGPLTWTISEGPDRYRRSLYTFAKRTTPFAMLNTFDAPSGEACTARRERTNSPLQALTLLNDDMFLEMSRALGRDTASKPGSIEDRAAHLFRRFLTREPSAREQQMMVAFFQTQRARFASGALDPAALTGGEPSETLPDQAAWTALARALMNLDETITRS